MQPTFLTIRGFTRRFLPVRLIRLTGLSVVCGLALTPAVAQVRTKLPDRGTYQSPQIKSTSLRSVVLEDARDGVQPVAYDDVVLLEPSNSVLHSDTIVHEDGNIVFDEPIYSDSNFNDSHFNDSHFNDSHFNDSHFNDSHLTIPGSASCDGCGSCGGGCDSMGCGSCGGGGCDCEGLGFGRSAISFCRDQWFGGVDLMLMYRNGDRMPPLVTTGPATNIATSGALDQTTTRIIGGNDRVFDQGTIGGRLTLGTWLDESQCRSLVFRGWIAGEDTFGFDADQDSGVLARPFLNVSSLPNAQDTLLVAFPGAATGSVHVRGSSNVFGGDISVRQLMYGRFGGTLDFLYGYQYMRLDEDLRVSSTSMSQDGQFAPPGTVISIADSIDTVNEFHGGQVGVASKYREGCWSFRGLAKVGFGSLRRSATRRGSTTTQLGADEDSVSQGLLVRSTNSGVENDSTFGWIPELDVSLGWHYFPGFDVTLGYHIIAMGDALQVSGAVDPNLASNLSDPLVGTPLPSRALRFDTFYIQGIHVGLQYVY